MNVKAISRNVGFALLVSALFMLLSILISVGSGNDSALAALIISFTITFIVGIFPFIFVRKTAPITLKDGYVIIVLSWLLSFVFGMLPYVLWGGPFSVANAWFESVSGFTTTGATILDDIEALPRSLLFWRSSTHFIGGLGVVVLLLLIIPNSSPVRMRLTSMELSSLSKEAYNSRANKTVFIFAYVYISFVVLSFLAYWAAGMSAFDAINHALSVSATGGFSTRNLSIGAFDSRLIEGITMLFMFLSSLHFGILYMTVVTRSFRPLDNPVLKFYVCSLLAIILAVSCCFKFGGVSETWGTALWCGAFQTLCTTTTTGFAIMDNTTWPLLANLIIMLAGVMCACAGSTSGGIKADRVLVFFKSISRQVRQALHPLSVNEIRLGGHILRNEEVQPHIMFILLYLVIMAISMLAAAAFGADATQAMSGSLACMGNLGPAMGDLGTMGNFNGLNDATKVLFSFDMFLGRVEILPVLAVMSMLFNIRKKRRNG